MKSFRVFSASEQVAERLREGLAQGTWTGEMPGVKQLTAELGVNHKTVEAALALLEGEGVLVSQGPRRRRRIVVEPGERRKRSLRIAILCFDDGDRREEHMLEILHQLNQGGHGPFFASRTLEELDFDPQRVAEFVGKVEADAWLVVAGSREVLEWFGEQAFPVFALFGRWGSARVAGVGPKKTPAYVEVVDRLVALGHRRIVMLARPQRIRPKPGAPEQAFLDALQARGLPVSVDYNLPLWENTREGFHRRLEALFGVTPPTALIVQEPMLFAAVQQFVARHGLRVPEGVSLVCADPDANFAWQRPTVAHIATDSSAWVRHVLRWASRISAGRPFLRQLSTKAQFVPGGTIGPVGVRS